MSKVGIYRIGFKEQNEVDDQWVMQEEQQERSSPDIYIDGSHKFMSIDQDQSSISQELTADESGPMYDISLSFAVHTGNDIALAKKYERRPVVIYADTVDGKRYTIGTKAYPVMMLTSDRYDARNTRVMDVSVGFQSRTAIL